MFLPKELATVTPLSKTLAMILFIALPFIGFYFGMRYQSMVDLNKQEQENIISVTNEEMITDYNKTDLPVELSVDSSANLPDYSLCSTAEKTPFQDIDFITYSSEVGYIDIDGIIVKREQPGYEEPLAGTIQGIFLKVTPQKVNPNAQFYSRWIGEAEGSSAGALKENDNLLFRLGKLDQNGEFSSTASFSNNFQNKLNNAIENQTNVTLHLVIPLVGCCHVPSNYSAACRIELL